MTDIYDLYTGENSECCDAPILMPDICSECKDHTEPIESEEDEEVQETLKGESI